MANPRPHVCFVAPHAFPLLSGSADIELVGGAELQQVLVARGLVNRGYRVTMICLNYGQPDRIEIDGICVLRSFRPNEGVPVIRFLWPRLTSMWACLTRADADIYYQRTAGVWTGVVAAFCKRNHKKSIFAAAGNPDLVRNTPRIRFARDRRIYEYGLRNVDRIFVQNAEQAQLCWETVRRVAALVPNCYSPSEPISSRNAEYVLWVSTIRALKRPHLFLDLAESLPRLRFRMIGGPSPGEDALFEAIKKRSARIGNLEFVGFVPYAKVETHFDGASLLVNTSESEGFPNTFLQAWARRVPTVSFVDSGAIHDGVSVGVIVSDMKAMVAEIARLATTEAIRSAIGDAAFEYYTKTHQPGSVLDLYETQICELLGISDSMNGSPVSGAFPQTRGNGQI